MGICRAFVGCLLAALGVVMGCGDDGSSSVAGGGGAGGASGTGSTTSSTSTGAGTGEGGAAVVGEMTHCEPTAFRCFWATGLFGCAEYSQADAATYQPLCEDGGTWQSGHCTETGALGACLPMNYCNGMGIGFVYDAAMVADAQGSCESVGGTWEPGP